MACRLLPVLGAAQHAAGELDSAVTTFEETAALMAMPGCTKRAGHIDGDAALQFWGQRVTDKASLHLPHALFDDTTGPGIKAC